MIPALGILGRLRAFGAWLLRHPMAALAAIGAVVLLVYRGQRDKARGQRDAANKTAATERTRADGATAAAEALRDHADDQEAGFAAGRRISDAPTTGDVARDMDDLLDRVRAADAAREDDDRLPADARLRPARRPERGGSDVRDAGLRAVPDRSRGVDGVRPDGVPHEREAEVGRGPGDEAAPDVTAGEFEGSEMIEELK